jgi:phosphatidate phosphatase APP1
MIRTGRGPISGWLNRLRRALDRTVRAAVRPARRAARRGTLVVQPYRGFGSARQIFVIGRVFREPATGRDDERGVIANLKAIWRLMRRWGVKQAALTVSFAGVSRELSTDRDGYFEARLPLEAPPPADRRWHRVGIELTAPDRITTEADIFIPPPACRFVVISDIDDTVMYTGVANKLKMMWRLFVQRADSRVAFPGMAAFLQALHRGAGGDEHNPMLYVSRAPWAIYGVLDAFFNAHEIPVGPILFLREWGLTLQSPLPRRAKGHKSDLIKEMMALYSDLPVILIGDSGQRDPELYADVVHAHPDRVLAIYIRDVSTDRGRDQSIERLAAEIEMAGSRLVLAADTLAMAEHAAREGYIKGDELPRMSMEREHDLAPLAGTAD